MASKLLQIRLDENLKAEADEVFASMGLDTSTAVRLFLVAAVETRGLPFEVKARNGAAVRKPFQYGNMSGRVFIADDFDAPIDDFME